MFPTGVVDSHEFAYYKRNPIMTDPSLDDAHYEQVAIAALVDRWQNLGGKAGAVFAIQNVLTLSGIVPERD